jgi:excisionase family DNA binding protein
MCIFSESFHVAGKLVLDIALVSVVSYIEFTKRRHIMLTATRALTEKDTATARVLFRALLDASLTPKDVSVKIRGQQVTLPKAMVLALMEAAKLVSEGHAIDVRPADQNVDREISTQKAADMLKVSRPYLLNLVKKGILPCRMVGAHHRIPMDALIAYQRDQAPRRRSLEALTAETQELGR